MATITLYARVRKENANNEFAFLDRDNKNFNLKKIFPSDSKKITLVFGDLSVETERGGAENQFYLKAPKRCIINHKKIEGISQKN